VLDDVLPGIVAQDASIGIEGDRGFAEPIVPGVRGRLRLNQFAVPRNALIRFVCTFDAVLELEPIVWELFGHFIDPTRHIATDCRPEHHALAYGTYVKASGIPEEATELNSPNGVVRFTPIA